MSTEIARKLEDIQLNEIQTAIKALNNSGFLSSKLKVVGTKENLLTSFIDAVNSLSEDTDFPEEVVNFYNSLITGEYTEEEPEPEPEEGDSDEDEDEPEVEEEEPTEDDSDGPEDDEPEVEEGEPEEGEPEPEKKKGRGRPKKSEPKEGEPEKKKGPGRPKKGEEKPKPEKKERVRDDAKANIIIDMLSQEQKASDIIDELVARFEISKGSAKSLIAKIRGVRNAVLEPNDNAYSKIYEGLCEGKEDFPYSKPMVDTVKRYKHLFE